jgi:heat shock protein HslJ
MKCIILLISLFIVEINFAGTKSKTQIFEVDSKQVLCEGSKTKKCLVVRRDGSAKWESFGEKIVGFTFIEGYKYKLEVKVESTEEKGKTKSLVVYKLFKTIERVKAELASNTEIKHEINVDTVVTKKGSLNKNSIVDSASLEGKKYVLHTLGMIDLNGIDVLPNMDFANGKVYGNSGCNRYNARFTLSNGEVKFAPPLATKKLCMNKIGAIELEFLKDMDLARFVVYDEDKLIFKDEDNQTLMIFSEK